MADDDLDPETPEDSGMDDGMEDGDGGALQATDDGLGDGMDEAMDREDALAGDRRAIFSVPVEVVVSVGRARPLIGEMMSLRRDSVLPLDSRIDDPVEIYVGDRLVARGELQELDDQNGQLGVRLTEVVGYQAA